jgi:hypothetical protein
MFTRTSPAQALPCLVLSRRQQAGADVPEDLESASAAIDDAAAASRPS